MSDKRQQQHICEMCNSKMTEYPLNINYTKDEYIDINGEKIKTIMPDSNNYINVLIACDNCTFAKVERNAKH